MSFSNRVRAVFVRLSQLSKTERLFISLASLVLAIAVGTLLILASGRMTTCRESAFILTNPHPLAVPRLFEIGFCYNPVTVYDQLFLGALGDPFSGGWSPLNPQFGVTIRETTVLIFTGLSVALAFRAGIFNIGTQGQMVIGALATALGVLWLSSFFSGVVGTLTLVPLGLLLGAIFGGLYGAVPGVLKAYADANEVITTIMLNFIATGVVLYLVSDVFKDPNSPANQTVPLPEYATFPSLLFDSGASVSIIAFAVGVVSLVALFLFIERTRFGYDVRTSGLQPAAAEYGGVDSKRTIVASMTLSGALGGVAGAIYVLMVLGNFQTGVPSYGFDGITVAILAGNNPLGVGLSAFLFGILKSGSTVVQVGSDVPPQLVGVLRGLIILFVAMPEFFRIVGRRIAPSNPEAEPTVTTEAPTGGSSDG